jgi:hypothetical protein
MCTTKSHIIITQVRTHSRTHTHKTLGYMLKTSTQIEYMCSECCDRKGKQAQSNADVGLNK